MIDIVIGTSLGSLGHLIELGSSVELEMGNSFWLCYLGLILCLVFIILFELLGKRIGRFNGLIIVGLGLSVIITVVTLEVLQVTH